MVKLLPGSDLIFTISQFISIDSYRSLNRPLTCGMPQGSVLGLILYLMYVSPVGCIMHRHGVSYHMYADDCKFTSLSSQMI